ncbi:hypothetical protein [Paraburkholderia diazotrophica]|uniref:Uncharacterized protein n=1 Tax=Paraburkholderia diazotrophica TaxID=667676 RepID=A0A1H7DSG9_9BURK|nr:hypothetical protein [Paraburkholderia diazotrophica]SEK02240.1 hypothetical protein SAMN05192539_103143 [Paraburkholderia diazotrophica]
MSTSNAEKPIMRAEAQTFTSVLRIILPWLAPAFFIGSTIIGAVKWFSPVPFWDMWDGTLQFYAGRLQGNRWLAFLEQANEHRIILTKVLFWIDYRFFQGLSHFLIAANIVLMFALWLTLCFIARALTSENQRLSYLCNALIAVPCFSWLQAENINWGYQSQFYMAYLLPLLALFSMARWVHEPGRRVRFVVAVLLGMLSTVTMANGLLTPVLLIAMLALSGQSTIRRMLSLICVAVLTFAAWAYHYHALPHAGAPFRTMMKFLLMFFGAPIGFMFHNDVLTMLVGAAAIFSAIYLAVQWTRGATRNPAFLALVLFAVHIGAAGAAATISRANFGLDAALAGRYETPIMLLYCVLLLLFVHLHRVHTATTAVVATLSVFIPLMLFTSQLAAFSLAGRENALQRARAALALNLDIDDRDSIAHVYPQETEDQRRQLRRVVNNGIRYNLSVFGLPEMRSAREAMGKTPASAKLSACDSAIDSVKPITSDPAHVRLTGWAFDAKAHRVPKVIFFVSDGVVTGAGLTGTDRQDMQMAIDKAAVKTGFEGYASAKGKDSISVFCPE